MTERLLGYPAQGFPPSRDLSGVHEGFSLLSVCISEMPSSSTPNVAPQQKAHLQVYGNRIHLTRKAEILLWRHLKIRLLQFFMLGLCRHLLKLFFKS